MEISEEPSGSSLNKAEKILLKLKPQVAQMLERLGPTNRQVTLNEIESDSAARGDLLSRLLMEELFGAQNNATDLEVKQAKVDALNRAAPELSQKFKPETLRMVRMKDKQRTLNTARGKVPLRREYLYFPDLKVGIFPPRNSVKNPGTRPDPSSRKAPDGRDCQE